MATPNGIARVIQRLQDFRAEAPAFLENLIDQGPVCRGMCGQHGQVSLCIKQFVQDKLQVPQRSMVLGHRENSSIYD
jgi:hypothetical protein